MGWGWQQLVSGYGPSGTAKEYGFVLSHRLPWTAWAREGGMGWIVRNQPGAIHLGGEEKRKVPGTREDGAHNMESHGLPQRYCLTGAI